VSRLRNALKQKSLTGAKDIPIVLDLPCNTIEYGTDKLTSEIGKTPVILAVLDHCIFPRRKGT
jgi:hypothetical protein